VSEPGTQIGRYVIVREIGRGGMAAVYLARQVDLDRDVALKELAAFHAADPAVAERFLRESRMAGSMNHPNIVTVYEFLTVGGVPYIAMEYLERGSLRGYVGRTTLGQTIGALEGALAGLAQAERRDIVHRDIKPENLMVTTDGEVKVADFGIAKGLTEGAGRNLTATGSTIGTPAYMAPEQATAGAIGPWTDLYSIGITAYEMTVGRVPFHEPDTPVAVLLRQVNEEIPSAVAVDPGIDSRLSEWIDRLLVKDPQRRTQSAREAWYELEEIAVAVLGPLWRRDARLVGPGGETVAAPLTPAPFGGETPPEEPAAPTAPEYVTYAGRTDAAPPPPAPPSPPPESPPPPPPSQPQPPVGAPTIPPSPPAETANETTDPSRTAAPDAAPPREMVVQPIPRGRNRRGLAIAGAVLVAIAVVAGLVVWRASGGSGKGNGGGSGNSVPTVTPDPSRLQHRFVGSIAAYQGRPWGITHPADSIVDVLRPSASPIPISKRMTGLSSGDGALWVPNITSKTSGQVRRVAPGTADPTGRPISFTGRPAGVRPVVDGGTIWQAIDGGLLKISEQTGKSVPVKDLTFTPFSLELIDNSIWATDGKSTLARVPTSGAPTATSFHVDGAGWITGNNASLYVTTSTGVSMIDPSNPQTPKPLSSVTAAPTRIGLVDNILWMSTYVPRNTSTQTVTLVGVDVKNGRRTKPVKFIAPTFGPSKLVAFDNTFWLLVGTRENPGLEPFVISGG
jgi:serine/threonine protein kinase